MDPGWEFAAPRKRETRGYDNRDRRNSRDGPERIVVRDDSGEETWEAVVTKHYQPLIQRIISRRSSKQ